MLDEVFSKLSFYDELAQHSPSCNYFESKRTLTWLE